MRPLRVLVVSQYFWPENFRINDLAAELVSRGHHVTVLTGVPNYPEGIAYPEFRRDPGHFANYAGAAVVRVPLVSRGQSKARLVVNYLSFVITGMFVAPWRLRGRKFDVIFVFQTSPITSAIPALFLRWLKRAPMLLWVLDLWPESLQAVGAVTSPRLISCVGKLVRLVYRRSDLILVQAKAFIPNIVKYGGERASIRYFPNWAEPALQNRSGSADDLAPATELAPYADTFNIMFAGNIGEAQDFPAILTAAAMLRDECPQVRWLIVGDGRAASMVRDEIRKRGLDKYFILLGRFPLQRMPALFRGASAALVSLRRGAVFSLTIPGKLQSYLSAGVPVLGMLDGEAARVISESGAGIAVPAGASAQLADAVRHMLMLSSSERQSMGASGQAYCTREFDRSSLMSALETWMDEARRRGIPELLA